MHADQIIFKNGRSLECHIIAEHAVHVEISLGTGTMNIPHSQLKKLTHTKPTGEIAKKPDRERKNILSAQHVPKAHSELAAEFRKLMTQRNMAFDAQYMMTIHEQEISELKNQAQQFSEEILQLQEALAEISKKTAEIKIPDQPPQNRSTARNYNKLISEKQKLYNEGSIIHSQIAPLERKRTDTLNHVPDLKKKYKETLQPIPIYHKSLQHFSSHYFKYKQTHELDTEDEASKSLFKKIDRYLVKFKKEMPTTSIKAKQIGNSTIVQVFVNGTTSGEFVFDTGATTMTISESFAKKLGIQTETLPKRQGTVADGRIVESRTAILSSVMLGSEEVKDVEVAIFPDSPNNREDGLLGMSFLKYFSIGFNGTTGKIELTRLSSDH